MVQIKMYKYIGYNGTFTTPILLPLDHQDLVELIADNGHYLTDGNRSLYRVTIEAAEVDNWKEVKGDLN